MLSRPVHASRDMQEAYDRFSIEIGAWIASAISEYRHTPPSNVHDQGTYTTAWAPYIRYTGEHEPYRFMSELRDRIAEHFTATDKWHHGYWRMQEAHHGTEHYELFLGALCEIDPHDETTVRQLDDAAEHFGNWSADVPAWYDWERGLYLSMYFGTNGLDKADTAWLNIPDHLRCTNIALLAYRSTNNTRYLDLASAYAGRWADALLSDERIPVGLDENGGVYELEGSAAAAYRGVAGMVFQNEEGALTNEVDRAENFLASGVIKTFLELYEVKKDTRLLKAAERLLDVLATQVSDPDAGAAVADLRRYRRLTGSNRYEAPIRHALKELEPHSIAEVAIHVPENPKTKPAGIGKRADMPHWFEGGAPRRHAPILLAEAAELDADEDLARVALDLGRTYLSLAREVFPHGRDHGCSARSISAIARGHGRDNHAGVVTELYQPLGQAFAL